MKNNDYEYKDETVEGAIAQGLLDLGLTEEEADIEILSEGGVFKKATVKVSPKAKEETPEEESEEVTVEITSEDEVDFKSLDPELVEQVKEKAFQFVKGLIEIMGVDCEVSVKVTDEAIVISVDGPEARIIIGRRGDVLDAIQFLALTIGNKEHRSFARVTVDAENYRAKRAESLKRVAENYSKKAIKYGEIVELEPMNPFERRVIHTTLKDDKSVVTRSEGEGRDRHIIIIPLDEEGNEITKRQRNTRSGSYGSYNDSGNYGTSSDFRRKGAGRMKTYGGPKKRF
ncbi:MAG: R3H domain protein [Firmicutes bacterium ADurb.Bin080]|jgi:spoIIIJ-associated protein|nr:protein jag [Clostridiales bacterium]OQC15442.1 MAG: R3H domain protein [Firmicutes bacterium ADurb.Bin080]